MKEDRSTKKAQRSDLRDSRKNWGEVRGEGGGGGGCGEKQVCELELVGRNKEGMVGGVAAGGTCVV